MAQLVTHWGEAQTLAIETQDAQGMNHSYLLDLKGWDKHRI